MIGAQAHSQLGADSEAEALPLIEATVSRAVQAQSTVNTLIATPEATRARAALASLSDQIIAIQSVLRQ